MPLVMASTNQIALEKCLSQFMDHSNKQMVSVTNKIKMISENRHTASMVIDPPSTASKKRKMTETVEGGETSFLHPDLTQKLQHPQ